MGRLLPVAEFLEGLLTAYRGPSARFSGLSALATNCDKRLKGLVR